MQSFTTLPPLALYIHFPWCVQKCPYCDFNSHQMKSTLPEQEYIDALLKDLEDDLPLVWGRRISTIFMGGGTPSLFSPEAIEYLLNGIRARIPLSPFAEITMEANPGTLDNKRIPSFKEAGINRISLGVQSFNNTHLEKLGRIHNADKAIEAIEIAKTAAFEKINIDIMFGLPNQTLTEAERDIDTAIQLGTDHISFYELTLEPNTAFFQNPPKLPNEDLTWEIFQQGLNKLNNNKYARYEISAYAQQDKQCLHNLNYWNFGDYLGIGAGAHAKITDAHQQSVTRYIKKRNPKDYLAAQSGNSFCSSTKILDREHLLFEFLLNTLRLTNGFDLDTFEKNTGLEKNQLINRLEKAINDQLVEFTPEKNHIKPSNKGIHFINNILEPFLPIN